MSEPQTKKNISNGHIPATTWTTRESTPDFTVYEHGRSIKIVLTQAQNGNKLSRTMISGLTTLFTGVAAETGIWRIVFTSEGKYFCTGMNIKGMEPKHSQDHFSEVYNLFEAIDSCPQTTIAAINGPAYGGGVGLAFVCDIRVAVADATMCVSDVKLGLCPGTISRYPVREWGVGLARMAFLTGKVILLGELRNLGAVHTIVPEQEALPSAIDQWLYELRFADPRASALCKKLARDCWKDAGGEMQFESSREVFLAMMNQDSHCHRGLEDFRKGKRGTDWDTVLAEA